MIFHSLKFDGTAEHFSWRHGIAAIVGTQSRARRLLVLPCDKAAPGRSQRIKPGLTLSGQIFIQIIGKNVGAGSELPGTDFQIHTNKCVVDGHLGDGGRDHGLRDHNGIGTDRSSAAKAKPCQQQSSQRGIEMAGQTIHGS